MTIKHSALLPTILVLGIAACASATLPSPVSRTAVPPTASFLPTNTATCETHTASVVLLSSFENPRVGDAVTITVELNNEGCVGLGLPQYRIATQSDEAYPIFDPANPEPIVHSLGVAPGQSDSAKFDLHAIARGQTTFTASVSFEVHLGYPGPAYWGSSSGEPLEVVVTP